MTMHVTAAVIWATWKIPTPSHIFIARVTSGAYS